MAKPVVALVGKPNVGKSTVFNRIVGERLSIVEDMPGVTRDRLYAPASWLTKDFMLVDTGGIEKGDAPFVEQIKMQAEIAIEQADVVIFLVDINQTISKDEHLIASILRKAKKKVIVAANKVDDQSKLDDVYALYELGFGQPMAISGTHGQGVGDLLDKVIDLLDFEEEVQEEDVINFCLIGMPNVGKSSLVNSLVGKERVIVSDLAGTTRDSIDTKINKNGKKYNIIDTAGIRKKGKIYENVEKYSVLRSLSAIDRSDVVVLVLDANKGVTEQDKRVAGYAYDAKKAVIIVVNKWDSIEKDTHTAIEMEKDLKYVFNFLPYAPFIFLSALTGKGTHKLFPVIERVYENYNRRVATNVLNDIVVDASLRQPPANHNGGQINIYYATQVDNKPPTFVLFVNDPDYMHFTYKRYIENKIREAFDLEGTAIKIICRKRK